MIKMTKDTLKNKSTITESGEPKKGRWMSLKVWFMRDFKGKENPRRGEDCYEYPVILKIWVVLGVGLMALLFLTGCASKPELAQVDCCIEKPINTPEWVEKKQKEFEIKMAQRNAALALIDKAAQAPDDTKEAAIKELQESEAFQKAHQEAMELARAALDATPPICDEICWREKQREIEGKKKKLPAK